MAVHKSTGTPFGGKGDCAHNWVQTNFGFDIFVTDSGLPALEDQWVFECEVCGAVRIDCETTIYGEEEEEEQQYLEDFDLPR